MKLSIIIPTLNESERIGPLVHYLLEHGGEHLLEVMVVDGGSEDSTLIQAQRAGASTFTVVGKGRAAQLNHGAQKARGEVLYFIYADSTPPASFYNDIMAAIAKGYSLGCYRYQFDSNKLMLKINAYFTRFDRLWCRGGDETLFVRRPLFEQLEGFDEKWVIMEEYDFLIRARKLAKFCIIPKNARVSARKYDQNSYLRVNFANLVVFTMFRLGYSPKTLLRTYKRLLQGYWDKQPSLDQAKL